MKFFIKIIHQQLHMKIDFNIIMEDEGYKEQEKCEYWDCIMCHWGCCTGDKQFAKELNLCKKKDEDDW